MGFLRNILDSIFAPAGAFDNSSSSHFGAGVETAARDDVADNLSGREEILVNPTTGLQMVSGIGGVDVGGHTWCEPTYSTGAQDSPSSWSHNSMFNECGGSSFNAPCSWESSSMDFSRGSSSFDWNT